MPYRIAKGRPLGQEITQLFDHQIAAAVSCLTDANRADTGRRIHEARKHIKKARALLQLAGRSPGVAYQKIDDELRMAKRALGPLADATRYATTLGHVRTNDTARLPASIFDSVRMRLHANAAVVNDRVTRDAVRARTTRLLDSVRQQALGWNLRDIDEDAIVRAMLACHGATRQRRRRARGRPTIDAYHSWRRRAKREWYLLRLIEDLTGGRVTDEAHELAALDACLGRLHDIQMLAEAVAADSPLSRHDTARLLVVLRSQTRDERRRAHALAAVLNERPRDLALRIHALWGAPPRPAVIREQPWLRRA